MHRDHHFVISHQPASGNMYSYGTTYMCQTGSYGTTYLRWTGSYGTMYLCLAGAMYDVDVWQATAATILICVTQ